MAKIIIAGGTGMLGQALEKALLDENHDVYILTRSPKKNNHIKWDLKKKTIDTALLDNVEIVINLCGESVGDKRWTNKRKQELLNSRVETTTFLHSIFGDQVSLKQYLSASGVNAYPLDRATQMFEEKDAFGDDYLSQLVQKWEESADLFSDKVPIFKLRISMVLSPKGGALSKLLPLIRFGIASPMGKGSQCSNWVHIDDVSGAFVHAVDKTLDGAYNLSGEIVTNRLFTNELMKAYDKNMWAPNVPGFILKIIMGERATIVLDGVQASSKKLESTGFSFQHPQLKGALEDLFGK